MGEPDDRLIDHLVSLWQELGEFMDEFSRRGDVPLAHVLILRQVCKTPGITVSELARQTRLAKSHVSVIVRCLVGEQGLRRRVDESDRRLVRVYAPPKADCEHCMQHLRRHFGRLVAAIPAKERDDVMAALEALRRALQTVTEGNEGE